MTCRCGKRQFGPKPNYPLAAAYDCPTTFITNLGPCSIENPEHAWQMAGVVANLGATHFRGGVYRAGTYPPATEPFGLVEDMMRVKYIAAKSHGLQCVNECVDVRSVENMAIYTDVFQIGHRHMSHWPLLEAIAKTKYPVFMKRNSSATLDEVMGSLEYLLKFGATRVVLVERGIRTFNNHCRYTPDVSFIAAVKKYFGVPVMVDASHGTGVSDFVGPCSFAGIAAGADGIALEVHMDPKKSISDAEQAITPAAARKILKRVGEMRGA